MADQVLTELRPSPLTSDNFNKFSTEFDSLPIPPLDSLFFSENNHTNGLTSDTYISDLGMDLGFDENADFNLSFDDLDDLDLPSDAEDFLLSNGVDAIQQHGLATAPTVQVSNSSSQELDASGVSTDRALDVGHFLNFPTSESDSYGREYSPPVSSEDSGDPNTNGARVSNFPSTDSGGSDRELSGGSVSSQGSGYRPSSPISLNAIVLDQNVKMEEEMGSKRCVLKRKKEQDEGNTTESRTMKYMRSAENGNSNATGNGEEDKRKARLMRNRESAQLSRQRKKHYVEELEDKVRNMHSTIADLNSKISYIMAENATLRQQLSGGAAGGMCAPGMFPHPAMAAMGYPWMPCAPYVVKPQGSQVPLVPIPRLKPQQSVPAPKVKKSESKRIEGKTKKVASVSFLGLLFFVLLFGGMVPLLNVRYGGVGDKVPSGLDYVSGRLYDEHRGRVLGVNGYLNVSGGSVGVGFSGGKWDNSNRVNNGRGRLLEESELERKGKGSEPSQGSDESVRLGNAREPLVASLYVPRNDKLVKIDGNLIIHSVLASEKAMASQVSPRKEENRETGLAIPGDLGPALAIPEVGGNRGRHSHLYVKPTGGQKALASGSADTLKDHVKSSAADGKLQQWFREGLAGPMLSSGMCTEVFQFDVSPASAPGAIIPASSVSNTSEEHCRNSTRLKKGRNRRILRGLPAPLTRSNYNLTKEHMGKDSQKGSFQGNKSSSPMIVSVLVDPREAGDSEIEGIITPKSLSRIFVVVLLDSVKYVTYSCVLPRSGPHLVTT
ncbi:TGACG-sequence-specific DNA-binding protein TGA-1B [Morella rubra]|uniref:TGACG-sequence-specific DNA-binding protein TGA-1B n=1 Tax=Morella rubra TaxID=262757 RepID=A0A6A1WH40_9ROSI|nr:TGACG-sequence-specific DNA-binding protein TGA-1B [Morella rubra]KAB1222979.1 TGACG-sequence-specific DNA-binding protein TGA-1B [Morella rubra]